ncbi:hypothetical protein FRC06_010840 [Ceratobasidium sp. 370]|nr:hypothetical protein FRC06_010840 [Ceratobasidium sp. 370]
MVATVWKSPTRTSKRKSSVGGQQSKKREREPERPKPSKRPRIVLQGDKESSDLDEPERPDSTANSQEVDSSDKRQALSSTTEDHGAGASASRRSRMLTISEITGEPARAPTPERQAAKVRIQKEAEPRYSPSPSTQAAAAPPPLLAPLVGPPYTQGDRPSPPPSDRPSSLARSPAAADTRQVEEAGPASEPMSRLSASPARRATAHEAAASSQLHGSTQPQDLPTVVHSMSIGSDVAEIDRFLAARETGLEPASTEDVEMAAPLKVAVSERPASSTHSPPALPETATPASPSSGLAVPSPPPPPPSGSSTPAVPLALPPAAGTPPPPLPPPPAPTRIVAKPVARAPPGHSLVPANGPDAGGINSLEGRSSRVRSDASAT